jgi:FlaA1/EpsC-like NDP-sugar epimerase
MKVLIIGPRGHAIVVADKISACNRTANALSIVGILDDNSDLHKESWRGIPVLGRITRFREIEHDAKVVLRCRC